MGNGYLIDYYSKLSERYIVQGIAILANECLES